MRALCRFLPVFAVLILPSLALAAAEVGKPAPDFTAQDINGGAQSLAQYKGKPVVLEWHNPECPFVQKHYNTKNMQALMAESIAGGAVWLTVNSGAPGKQGAMDTPQAKAKLAELGAAPSAYILDPEGAIGRLYGATATPHMFVVNAEGVLVYAGAIDNMPGFQENEVKGARNYVRQALAELKAVGRVSLPVTQAYGCAVKYK